MTYLSEILSSRFGAASSWEMDGGNVENGCALQVVVVDFLRYLGIAAE
jgi:hypothetical protein